MSEQEAKKEQDPKRKPSPSAPWRALSDCLEDVGAVYEMYKRSTFSRAEIASTLRVSATSGPFKARLFSLREFGLLEAVGENYVVSDLFVTLHDNAPATLAYKQAALKAVQRPVVLRNLLTQFGSKLPGADVVAQRLELQMGFARERAKDVATIFERSLRATGVVDSSGNILPIREDAPAVEPPAPSREVSAEPACQSAGNGHLRLEIALGGDGRRAIVLYPSDLSAAEAQKVGKVLTAIVE